MYSTSERLKLERGYCFVLRVSVLLLFRRILMSFGRRLAVMRLRSDGLLMSRRSTTSRVLTLEGQAETRRMLIRYMYVNIEESASRYRSFSSSTS